MLDGCRGKAACRMSVCIRRVVGSGPMEEICIWNRKGKLGSLYVFVEWFIGPVEEIRIRNRGVKVSTWLPEPEDAFSPFPAWRAWRSKQHEGKSTCQQQPRPDFFSPIIRARVFSAFILFCSHFCTSSFTLPSSSSRPRLTELAQDQFQTVQAAAHVHTVDEAATPSVHPPVPALTLLRPVQQHLFLSADHIQ